MIDEENIFQDPKWQNIEIIDVEKRMAESTREQMPITLQNVTDEQLEVMIDEANQKGYSVNLNIPATREVINWFFEKVFRCKRCGRCCRGDFHGAREVQLKEAIPILDEEISRLANFLKVRPRKIKRLCKTNSRGGLSLPYPCPFYSATPKPNCSVYSVRPLTCRYYPLYSVTAYKGLDERLNGKPLLSIDAECPQAKEIALQIFKWMRNAAQSGHYKPLTDSNTTLRC